MASGIDLKWNVTDKPRVHLIAAVDFSANAGKTWSSQNGPTEATLT